MSFTVNGEDAKNISRVQLLVDVNAACLYSRLVSSNSCFELTGYAMNSRLVRTSLVLATLLLLLAVESPHAQRRSKTAAPDTNSSTANLLEEGYALADKGKWNEAIEVFKRVIQIDPKLVEAYGALGDNYLNVGKWQQALATYKEAVRIAPSNAVAHYNLGHCYNFLGRHGEAFAPLVRATGLDPSFAEAYYEIGYAYLRGAQYEKSLPFFRSALRLDRNYAEAHYGLAFAYTKLHKLDLAEASRRELLALDPALSRKFDREVDASPLPLPVPRPTATPEALVAKSSPTPLPRPTPTPEAPAAKSSLTSDDEDPPPPPPSQSLRKDQAAATPVPLAKPVETSPPATVTETPARPLTRTAISALPDKAKRWAVIVGVDDYSEQQISKLNSSAADARALATALVDYAGFPVNQVILLAPSEPLQPRRNNILRTLTELRGRVPKDGVFLFAFTGHSFAYNSRSYLLPSDVVGIDDPALLDDTAISLSRIKELIRALEVNQVMVLLDAWRNDPTPARSNTDNLLSAEFSNALKFDFDGRAPSAYATIFATGVGQRAFDYNGKKQGYFVSSLIDGLKGQAANEKGEVTLGSLTRYLRDALPRAVQRDLEKQQTPLIIVEGYQADDVAITVASQPKP